MRKKKSTMTTFENKCIILSDIWLNYRYDDNFEDFSQYNDMGLPLAYAISEGIVKSTDTAATFIDETFDLLLAGLSIDDDLGFESLDEILSTGILPE
jgi:hypothetical protein